MYCQNCGAVLKEGVRFCQNCGAPAEAPKQFEPEPAPVEPKPAEPEYQPVKPVYQPAAPAYMPVNTIPPKPEARRSVAVAAILFAALAIGSFLQSAVSLSRYLGMIGGPDIRLMFYDLSIFFSALLLFLSALFLIISIAKELPDGKRPALGGIALLFLSLAFGFFVFQYTIGSRVLRWPIIAYTICYAVSAILFLVAAILAFANKRFAVLGLIGAIFYIALQILIMVYNLVMRKHTPGYPVTEIIVSEILPYVLRIFFGIALMIFSLKFRPRKN